MYPDLPSLLQLPFSTIAVLASGYLAYRTSYVGRDGTYRTVDTLFCTLAFAAVAQMVTQWAATALATPLPQVAGFGAAMATAVFWRRWGASWSFRALRAAGISTSDHLETAWDTIRLKPGFAPTTYIVKRTDGTLLMCHRPEDFAKLRDGPCILGADGSIALFVTDRLEPGATDWQPRDVFAEQLGYEMTYIPAAHVAEIRFTTVD